MKIGDIVKLTTGLWYVISSIDGDVLHGREVAKHYQPLIPFYKSEIFKLTPAFMRANDDYRMLYGGKCWCVADCGDNWYVMTDGNIRWLVDALGQCPADYRLNVIPL